MPGTPFSKADGIPACKKTIHYEVTVMNSRIVSLEFSMSKVDVYTD